MDKSVSNQIGRILTLYRNLPREPQRPCTLDDIKQKVRHLYNDSIEDESINKAIRRDLKVLEDILDSSSGSLTRFGGKGKLPLSYILSSNAFIEQFNPELSLVLVMANQYLAQNLPKEIHSKVEGFFEFAEEQLQNNTKLYEWQSRMRFVPEGYGKIQKKAHHELIEQKIYKALLDGDVWLKVKYRKEGSETQTEYTLKPQGIIQYGQKPYLMASKIVKSKSELRTFNMLRLAQVEIIPEKIAFDIETYELDELIEGREFEDAFFDREEQDIFFIVDESLLGELELMPFGEYQRIKLLDERQYELHATCVMTTSRMDWVIKNATLIQIVKPHYLYEDVQERMRVTAEWLNLTCY